MSGTPGSRALSPSRPGSFPRHQAGSGSPGREVPVMRCSASNRSKVPGPCAQIVYTLALKYLCRDYIKAKVCTIWAHGPI